MCIYNLSTIHLYLFIANTCMLIQPKQYNTLNGSVNTVFEDHSCQ